jgi:uncharacterized protein
MAAFTLITGASSGIGERFARAFAARRENLILVARSGDKLLALAEELRREHGVVIEVFPADLSAPAAAEALVRALGERHLEVETLVNNAGFGARGRFWELPLDRQREMFHLNVMAVVELTHRLVALMIAKRRGAIINVSSTAAFQPVAYTTLYGATKSFVTSFSMALAEEVRPYGIRVVTLCPGGTRTNFFQASQYSIREFKVPGGMMPPEAVVEAALRKLDGGGGLVISGWFNKFSVFSQRLAPRSLVARLAARVFKV